jgi:hypothetical protein
MQVVPELMFTIRPKRRSRMAGRVPAACSARAVAAPIPWCRGLLPDAGQAGPSLRVMAVSASPGLRTVRLDRSAIDSTKSAASPVFSGCYR